MARICEDLEEVYRVTHPIITMVQSIYISGGMSELYRKIYGEMKLEIKHLIDLFPFLEHTPGAHGPLDLIRAIILYHSEKHSRYVNDGTYSVGLNYLSEKYGVYTHPKYLFELVRLGFIKLSANQPSGDTYVEIPNLYQFLQAYRSIFLSFWANNLGTISLAYDTAMIATKVQRQLTIESSPSNFLFPEVLDKCTKKVTKFWLSHMHKYMGVDDARMLFPYLTDIERSIMLLILFKMKITSNRNNNATFIFTFRDLNPEKNTVEKYEALLYLVYLKYIIPVSSDDKKKWAFDMDTKYKLVDHITLSTVTYPNHLSEYLCAIPEHLDDLLKSNFD